MLCGIAFSIPLIIILFFTKDYFADKELYCDLSASVGAERHYIYPILRDLGYEPTEGGNDIKNPIATKTRYNEGCGD